MCLETVLNIALNIFSVGFEVISGAVGLLALQSTAAECLALLIAPTSDIQNGCNLSCASQVPSIAGGVKQELLGSNSLTCFAYLHRMKMTVL